jgi:hypothetical protein
MLFVGNGCPLAATHALIAAVIVATGKVIVVVVSPDALKSTPSKELPILTE